MGSYPLRFFLFYRSPNYRQNMGPKAMNHFGWFPRKWEVGIEEDYYFKEHMRREA